MRAAFASALAAFAGGGITGFRHLFRIRRAADRDGLRRTAGRRGTTTAPAARPARRRSRAPRQLAACSTNSSGLTQRSTGWWRSDGRRYWVMVTMSQPASCRSRSACATSSRRLAHAEDQVGLGDQAVVAGRGEHREAAVVAERRADPLEDPRHGLDVVRQHLGPRLEDLARAASGSPLKSGISISTPVLGVELVDRAHGLGVQPGAAVGQVVAGDAGDGGVAQPHRAARDSATRRGSSRSSRRGLPVSIWQKSQRRVHCSPPIRKVASRSSQHSKMLGQPASSQTVCRPSRLHQRLAAPCTPGPSWRGS